MITIEIFGNPIPKKRPRFVSNKNRPHCYDSQATLKETMRWQIKSQFRETPLQCPISVYLIFFMPIPQSCSNIQMKQMANGLIGHIKKPDLDNLQKFILDCLNGLTFEDDAQICEIRAKKIYSKKPGTLIQIIPLSPGKKDLLYENCAR